MKYLLPCECGHKNVVDRAQAGRSITCQCGASLDVPALRHLSHLEPAAAEPAPPSRSAWGPWHAVATLGLFIIAVGGGSAAYAYFFPPQPPPFPEAAELERIRPQDVARMSPIEAFRLWDTVKTGINPIDRQRMEQYDNEVEAYFKVLHEQVRWFWACLVAAGIGIAVTIGGLVGIIATRIAPRR